MMTIELVKSYWNEQGLRSLITFHGSMVDVALNAGDVLVVVETGNYTDPEASRLTSIDISNIGLSLTRKNFGSHASYWVGTVVTPSVGTAWTLTTTGPDLSTVTRRRIYLHILRGFSTDVSGFRLKTLPEGGTATLDTISAKKGDVVLATGYADSSADAWQPTPTDGWVVPTVSPLYSTRTATAGLRLPAGVDEDHSLTTYRFSSITEASMVVLYGPDSTPPIDPVDPDPVDPDPVEPDPVEPDPVESSDRSFLTFKNGVWVPGFSKVSKDSMWVPVYPKVLGDPGWVLSEEQIDPPPIPDASTSMIDSMIDAATSTTQIQDALNLVADEYQISIRIRNSTAGGVSFAHPSTFDDGFLKPAAKGLVNAIMQYPRSLFLKPLTGDPFGLTYNLGRGITKNGLTYSGFFSVINIAINTEGTAYGKDTIGLQDTYLSRLYITHHETAHALWYLRNDAARKAHRDAIEKANPPGWVYYGLDDRDLPDWSGEHPVAFPRAYGRINSNEDQADIFGWLLTRQLWERDKVRWFESDPYLAAKANSTKNWMAHMGIEAPSWFSA